MADTSDLTKLNNPEKLTPDLLPEQSKRLKILLVGTGIPSPNMGDIGGGGRAVIKLAETLAKRENVAVLPWWSEKPTLFRKTPVINGVEYLRRKITPALLACMFRHLFRGAFKTSTGHAAGLNKIKYSLSYIFDRAHIEVTLEHDAVDIIHIHGFGLSYLPYIDAALSRHIPLIFTSHGPDSVDPDTSRKFSSYEKYILKRLANTGGATITAVSTGVKEMYVKELNIPTDRITVIGNGVDQELFARSKKSKEELRKKYSIPQDKFILLQVGTLSKRKNHIAVLQAFASMETGLKQKIGYLIVGKGKKSGTLSGFVAENRLAENVFFAGFVPPGIKLAELYHLSDMLILPSTSEGMPLVFLEAMAAGLPIITFAGLEGVQDIYSPDCMELIPHRNKESLIAAIERSAGRKWDREKIIERNAFRTWDYACDKYRELYYKRLIDRTNAD